MRYTSLLGAYICLVKIVCFSWIFDYLAKIMHKNRLAKNLTSLKSYNYSSVNDSVSKDN